MSVTTIVKATDAAEFISIVPALLGFQPSESVVIVPFHGSQARGAMRFDLPPVEDARVYAQAAVGLVCKVENVTGAAVVIYGERDYADVVGGEIVAQAEVCGLTVVDALYVADGGWGHVGGDGTLSALVETPAHIAAMAGEADHEAGAHLPEVDEVLAREIGEIATAEEVAQDAVIDLFEAAQGWDVAALEAEPAAQLIAMLNRPMLRDVALMQWVRDFHFGHVAMRFQLDFLDGFALPEEIGGIMMGRMASPDAERLRRALDVCRHLAALAPEASKPGVLAATSWLAWALGRSSHAGVYAEAALRIDPAHGLASLMMKVTGSGLLPEWAFTR